MTIDLVAALIVFAFVASITPGPNNLMLLSSGANFGFQRTVPHLSGIVIGFTIMVALIGAGLMQLFTAFPVSYVVLKTASVAYLLFLSWKIATAAPPRDEAGKPAKSKPFTFLQAALFQWVNPKAWAMALTAITAYTPPSRPMHSVFLVALIFGTVNVPSICTWVLMGTQLRRFLAEPLKLRVFNIAVATLLVATLYPILFVR